MKRWSLHPKPSSVPFVPYRHVHTLPAHPSLHDLVDVFKSQDISTAPRQDVYPCICTAETFPFSAKKLSFSAATGSRTLPFSSQENRSPCKHMVLLLATKEPGLANCPFSCTYSGRYLLSIFKTSAVSPNPLDISRD